MKLLTFYTKTHADMYDKYFFPTYNKYLSKDFTIDSIYIDTDRDPVWGTSGFYKTVSDKIPIILNKLSQMKEGECLLFSDVDIIFLNPIKDLLVKEMGDNDILFSDDKGKICTGFIFMKNNDKVRRFFKNIQKNYSMNWGDQRNTRMFVRYHETDVKYKLFSSKFFNIPMMSYLGKDKNFVKDTSDWKLKEVSSKKDDMYIKLFAREMKTFLDTIVMFHANYLVSIAEKEKWLKIVLKEFNRNTLQ